MQRHGVLAAKHEVADVHRAAGARLDTGSVPLASAWHWLGAVAPALAAGDPAHGIADAWRRWRRVADTQRTTLPDDVADLPLTEIAPTAGAKDPANAHRIAIIVTGDGGWAGLDRGVADALAAEGARVIGFSTLKFFWHKQTPDAAAAAIARVITHYGAADADARFVVIGYSFGASLVPVIVNRLPAAARARVVRMLGPHGPEQSEPPPLPAGPADGPGDAAMEVLARRLEHIEHTARKVAHLAARPIIEKL